MRKLSMVAKTTLVASALYLVAAAIVQVVSEPVAGW